MMNSQGNTQVSDLSNPASTDNGNNTNVGFSSISNTTAGDSYISNLRLSGLPNGGETIDSSSSTVQSNSTSGDVRCIIKIPNSYYNNLSQDIFPYGKQFLTNNEGILFANSPNFNIESMANYEAKNPVHSNFTYFSYRNSQVPTINLSTRWIVQNGRDANVLAAVLHVLRVLTKMKTGADVDRGSPPPVCRLCAYGDWVFQNTPVSVANFRLELPDAVDYISSYPDASVALMPTLSNLSISLNPMFSREESQNFSVDNWLSGNLTKGYL